MGKQYRKAAKAPGARKESTVSRIHKAQSSLSASSSDEQIMRLLKNIANQTMIKSNYSNLWNACRCLADAKVLNKHG
jgi:hypothetical protein